MWGACSPTPCDWGTAPLPRVWDLPGGYSAIYKFSFATKTVTVLLPAWSTLATTTFTHFTDHSGRTDYTANDSFVRIGY